METNKRIANGSKLQILGQNLLDAGYEYWQEYQKELGRSAIVWLEGDNGHFILFTRSEYKESIMANAYRETKDEPVLFEPFTKNSGKGD